jgi:hypothetical protein
MLVVGAARQRKVASALHEVDRAISHDDNEADVQSTGGLHEPRRVHGTVVLYARSE